MLDGGRFRWLYSSNRQMMAVVVFSLVLVLGVGVFKVWQWYRSDELADIQTTKEPVPSKIFPKANNSSKIQQVELNTADSLAILALPGIGPKLTHRILKNRLTYGPFYAVSELRRIYGFDTIAPKIESYFYVDVNRLPKKNIPPPNSLDINSITEENLRLTGLFPPELCHRIIVYRDKKRGFRNISELKKVYGMTDSILQIIEKYAFTGTRAQDSTKKKKNQFLDLNQTDSVALEKLPGIGTKLAARIILYRNKLGFYHDKNQLLEVYGLKPESFQQFSDYVYVTNELSKYPHLQINQADVSGLGKHPYIGFTLAKRIVAYRAQHGKFRQYSDLLNIKEIEKQTWEKLSPYLVFE